MVTLKVYNVEGRLVRALVEDEQPSGTYSVLWDGRDSSNHPVASGIYFAHLKAGALRSTKKMLLLK